MLKNSRGMTLVEILIVLAIIGSLIAVLLPGITEKLNKSKVSNTKIAMSQVINALNMYYTDCGHFPKGLEGISKQDPECGNWGPEPYMKKTPKDGWNRDFGYEITGGTFLLKSLGSDGREGGDGLAKDITSEELQ